MDYYISIKDQIKRILTKNDLLSQYQINKESDEMSDLTDGEFYKKILNQEGKSRQNFFTLLINTDGISMFEKSNISIWPIILTINEISISKRFCLENVVIAGKYIFNV